MRNKILEWGLNCLLSKGYKIEGDPEVVVETPWSTVARFLTAEDCFYLKQTPADLFIEIEIIKAVQYNMPSSLTPTILFENAELHCFLMRRCGDHSLRTKFNGTINPDLLISGLNNYFKILRSFEQNLDVLEEIGVPDWRINQVPQLYVKLLENKALMLDEGLRQNEIDKLMRLLPIIESICESLSKQTLKETLVNSDLNENNLVINEKTQQISIIDWGESVIAHPFFSIASHLQSIARRYKLELKGEFLEKIKQQCLSCWRDVAHMDELEMIYQNILRLHPIFCALAIHRLQAATHHKSKEMQNWFIAGFLKMLLESESTRL
ncbi:aminoglycoside phosphotransferase family protein [Candidatus Berkiella cookevillensis]|uniref:Aminoglycoside phosphotransferase family protein n=1 Tax=Candidatus Berkiella cookevillensis TaxID=437022 RepID=A0A0Q9YMN9_9GAMM|nr:phosphotransferase [Candidatus Berkiella cookevillensis]MCS5707915.1 aminoglycoside phosphotransferase family protein [Candidatus Berkiella cookevillensis]